MKKRILLTGAAGDIGTMFREFAHDLYDIVCFDRRPTRGVPAAIVGDLGDLGALERAAQGCEAMVHLAAYPSHRGEFLSAILPSNIIGAYNAYEAAARAGVRRFVFASTVQVDYGYPDDVMVSVEMAPRPTNFYGASKVLGEHLGRLYSARRGLSVICLRFGMVVVPRAVEWLIARGRVPSEEVLLPKDACEIIRRSIDADGVDFAVLPAFSRNAERIRDLSPLKRVLGYEPQENAYELWGKRAAG